MVVPPMAREMQGPAGVWRGQPRHHVRARPSISLLLLKLACVLSVPLYSLLSSQGIRAPT
jgi:hypothetical protein